MTFINYFLYFIIYSFLGYICEVIYVSILDKKLTNRGFLYSPICPIYGFGALLIIFTLKPLASLNYFYIPILVFIAGFLLTTILEYITSVLLELIFKMRFWDYSKRFLNIKGRVCLRNSTMFGLLVILVIYLLDPLVISLVNYLPNIAIYIIFGVLALGLIVDIILSTIKHINISKAIHKLQEIKDNLNEKRKVLVEKLILKLNSLKKKYPDLKIKTNKVRISVEEYINKIKSKLKGE